MTINLFTMNFYPKKTMKIRHRDSNFLAVEVYIILNNLNTSFMWTACQRSFPTHWANPYPFLKFRVSMLGKTLDVDLKT